VFLKQDWKKLGQLNFREKTLEFYENYFNKFSWNKDITVPIVPCISGCASESEVSEKIKCGFSSSEGTGRFGQGIYVNTAPISQKFDTFLISYVIPGNVFPISPDDLTKSKPVTGNPIKAGYNSHFVLVHKETEEIANLETGNQMAEIVIGQQAQIIPAFVVRTKL